MKPSLKILILENSRIDAEIIVRLLKKEVPNATCHVAMSKEHFLNALVDLVPDIILADNSLLRLNATEALEISRAYIPYIPFIMVTGTVSEEFAAEIIKAGADDYIFKDRLTRLPNAIDVA